MVKTHNTNSKKYALLYIRSMIVINARQKKSKNSFIKLNTTLHKERRE
jgi:hypothetical protein